jgi:hypothetical protein
MYELAIVAVLFAVAVSLFLAGRYQRAAAAELREETAALRRTLVLLLEMAEHDGDMHAALLLRQRLEHLNWKHHGP